MNLPRTIISIYDRIYEYEYNWTDDMGFHQYYCTHDTAPMKGTIANFGYINNATGRQYRWTDNLGSHDYFYIN